jgi:proline iminopeptidase
MPEGLLEVGDGHRLAFEVEGPPDAPAAVVLHGGPGSGRSARSRALFAPGRWRLVRFDQRGSGASTPQAANPATDLAPITTQAMVADIERLRGHLGIARWLVQGGSWGATLALAYAQRHPERVTGLVLGPVTTTTRREIAWITRGAGAFLPEAWERFRDGVPPADRDGDLAEAYARLLARPDPAVRDRAAADWCAWEAAVVALDPRQAPSPRWADPRFRLGFARLVTHVWRHAAWLEEEALLRGMGRLAGIPGVLVHGRLDLGSPIGTAWALHRAWPGSNLVAVGGAGHDAGEPGMAEALAAAVARLRPDQASL